VNNINDDIIGAQKLLIKFNEAPWAMTATKTRIDDRLAVDRIMKNTNNDEQNDKCNYIRKPIAETDKLSSSNHTQKILCLFTFGRTSWSHVCLELCLALLQFVSSVDVLVTHMH
jgi:hypothetical protein